MMIIQMGTCQFICTVKIIINLLLWIYQDEKNPSIPQKINFAGKLEEDDSAAIFFIAERQEKTISDFSLNPVKVTE